MKNFGCQILKIFEALELKKKKKPLGYLNIRYSVSKMITAYSGYPTAICGG